MKYTYDAVFELIKNVIPNKCFVIKAPDNEQGNFIVFQKIDSTRWRSINAPSGIAQDFMQVDIYSQDIYTAKDNAAIIEGILDGFRGIVSYGDNSPQETIKIGGISLQNELDLIEQEEELSLFRVSQTYLITYDQE